MATSVLPGVSSKALLGSPAAVLASPCCRALQRQGGGMAAPSACSVSSRCAASPLQPLLRQRRPAVAARSSAPANDQPQQTASTSAPDAQQQEQQQSQEWKNMDLEMWHYKPFSFWWAKPSFVIAVGVGFVISANLLEGACLKTTVLAATPVALLWFIYLRVLPTQFKKFAIDWIETHPGANEAKKAQQS